MKIVVKIIMQFQLKNIHIIITKLNEKSLMTHYIAVLRHQYTHLYILEVADIEII